MFRIHLRLSLLYLGIITIPGCASNNHPTDSVKNIQTVDSRTLYTSKNNIYPGAWSHDNKSIFATLYNNDEAKIISIDVASGDVTTINTGLPSAGVADIKGNKLLLEANDGTQYDIFAYDLETQQLTQLTNTAHNEWHPAFHPNDPSIVYDADEDGKLGIFQQHPASGAPRRLSPSTSTEQYGRVSPNGKILIFHRQVGNKGNYDIIALNLETGIETQITSKPSDDSYATWLSDGHHILFSSNQTGKFNLYIVCAIGGDFLPLTSDASDDKYPKLSADGSMIVYQSNAGKHSQLKVMSVPDLPDCRKNSLSLVNHIKSGGIKTVNGLAITSDYSEIYATHWIETPEGRRASLIKYGFDGKAWELKGLIFDDSNFQDYQPVLSPDEKTLIFTSTRPLPGQSAAARQNIWTTSRLPDGSWATPKLIKGLESPDWDGHARITQDGWIYFASGRNGGLGDIDIYRARLSENITDIENVTGINSTLSDNDFYMPPDGSYIIMTRYDPETKDLDLFEAVFDGNSWRKPVQIDAVNTQEWQLSPIMTPDEKYLLYLNGQNGILMSKPWKKPGLNKPGL